MSAADHRLEDAAAALAVECLSGRTYRVPSSSGGEPHIVRGGVRQPLGTWTCDCQGAGGTRNFCRHKRRVAQFLLIEDRPERAAPRPRSKPVSQTTPRADIIGTTVRWEGAIAERATAVQASGYADGGGLVTLLIPDDGQLAMIVGALTAMRRRPLRITIEPATTPRQEDHDAA